MSTPAPTAPASAHPSPRVRFAVALLFGLFLIALGAAVIRHTELVVGRYMSAGVPPVLAVTSLLLLVALRPALRRVHPLLHLDRQQLLIIYAMMTVGVFVSGQYVVRAMLPHLVSLQYWGARYGPLARFTQYLPTWFAPSDTDIIRQYFEGAPGGSVPWGAWIVPLLAWGSLLLALFAATFSLVCLFERQWTRNERLSFPLLTLPLAITSGEGGIGDLVKQRLMWGGFLTATLFNAINVAHILNPSLPAPGFVYAFTGQFPDPPWTPLNTVMLFFMLDGIGFGYFVSLEVSFSAWLFYVLEKAFAIGGIAAGYDTPGFPFVQDQCAGAYLAVGCLVLFGARRALLAPLLPSLRRDPADPHDYRFERKAYVALAFSVAYVLLWCRMSGMALSIAVPFLALLFCFVLVYARLRAEAGVPFEFVYPYGLPKEMLINGMGARGVMESGGMRTWVILSSLAWLSRHHYAEGVAAYQADGLKLGQEAGIRRRWIIGALGVAVVFGLACAFWIHLGAYYGGGSNIAAGGTGQGEYRARVALQEYQLMASRATTPPAREQARIGAAGAGFVLALLLGVGRSRMTRSPLHPLGFILATSYGDHSTIFFPMFAAWCIKAAVLKAGGLPLYRRLIPYFVGLIVGHFLVGGILWPALSLLLLPETSRSYHLFFGG